MLIDDDTALIATFNMAKKYFGHARDYGIVARDPVQRRDPPLLDADWKRPLRPSSSSGLAWSADNSRPTMAAVIGDGARHRLDIEAPEVRRRDYFRPYRFWTQHRGVHRAAAVGRQSRHQPPTRRHLQLAGILRRAGVEVKRRAPQAHAKMMMIADGSKRVLVGS